MAFYAWFANLGHFWCSVVTFVTSGSNINNFERNPKKIYKQSQLSEIQQQKF